MGISSEARFGTSKDTNQPSPNQSGVSWLWMRTTSPCSFFRRSQMCLSISSSSIDRLSNCFEDLLLISPSRGAPQLCVLNIR